MAEEWIKTVHHAKENSIWMAGKFLINYIHEKNMSKIPAEYLRTDYPAESFYESCLAHCETLNRVNTGLREATDFINWVLENYFSAESDDGLKIIPSEYHNPVSKEAPNTSLHRKEDFTESNKSALPYRYIKQLRTILCPEEAVNLQDWKWAQGATNTRNGGGDWFIVEPSKIDKNDPDCVWRLRESTNNEIKVKGLPQSVYEIWSPVIAIGLYIKLLLPLRTYQVKMLDSGESDTYRYEQLKRHEAGYWVQNNGLLKKGTEKHPIRRGVFRKFNDQFTKVGMTGFYINTNKTADIDADEWSKGYEIPWQYEDALYWMVKLRNWQEKYNPIGKPTAWTELEQVHLGRVKSQSILSQMGETCFLFRKATEQDGGKDKPISRNDIDRYWYRLLNELELQCEALNSQQEGSHLKFVKGGGYSTYYPLHSLRVSLITAYALEGGVPMPILSKCIAGHARLLMTLYYTKAGITYVSEKMNEAEKQMLEKEQDSYLRWLKDATYKQLEIYGASNDPTSLQSVINGQQSGASFIKDEKGICPVGCLGCDIGGVYINEDTGGTTYSVVPGYPEQNCVRCRWFLTGPAFLPGLVYHFNVISYNMGETAERLMRFGNEIEYLEDLKLECEQNNLPFMENEKLSKAEKLYQEEMQKNDKLANDFSATLRLIDRCTAIINEPKADEQVQFVAVGTMADVKIAIENEPDNKLFQIQTVCNGATIFPEIDASKAVLQRSQILDLTLAMNGQRPIFFTLTPEQQLVAGNAWMQLLMHRAGSLKDALPYAEGRKMLAEIGLENELDSIIQTATKQSLRLYKDNNHNAVKCLHS